MTNNTILKRWYAAKTFADLINFNRAYLLGHIPTSPYHCGPIAEETLQIRSGLLRLHDFGILTFDSQPYERSISHVDCEFPIYCGGRCECPRYWEIWQKPYVCFMVESSRTGSMKLLTELTKNPDITVQRTEIANQEIVVPDLPKEKLTFSRHRQARSKEALKTFEWKTWAFSLKGVSEDGFFRSEVVKRHEPLLVFVGVAKWGVDNIDLLKLIEEAAISVGLADAKV